MEKVTFASNFWVAPSKARKNGRVENNISFHIARFTFATTVTIANHVSLEVAAKIRDYLQFATDPNTKEVVAMSNFTVRLCEQRAWDIKTGGYLENLRVFAESSSVQSNPVVTSLEGLMASAGSFQYKMKYYLDYREQYPDLAHAFECSVDIDPKHHHYYHKLGPEKIRANSCQESLLRRLINGNDSEELLKDYIQQQFRPGEEMSNKAAKRRLQEIYDGLGIGRTAKATDLERYFNVGKKTVTIDGKRTHGIKLGPRVQ